MKTTILISLLLLLSLTGRSQDYDKLNLSDSLRRIIDEDTSGKWHTYKLTENSDLFRPIEKTFRIKIKNREIQVIECRYYRIPKSNPEFASEISFTIHLDSGSVLQFNTSDNSLMLDTTIADINERLEKHQGGLPWSLHCWFYRSELLYYYSNGHGMTERDDFDAETYARETAEYFIGETKKRFPDLVK